MKRVAGETVRLAFAAGVAMALLVSSFACATAPRITKDELRAALGNPEVIVADDRSDGDWTSSEYKINGAIRVAPGEEEAWAARYPKDTMIVFYCSWPFEHTSARAAQSLIDEGYSRVYALKGGWREWFRAKYPVEPK